MGLVEGKVAIVTGAARGIGKTTAITLALEGARVGLVDILADLLPTSVDEVRSRGPGAIGVVTDATKVDQVERAVQKVLATFGQIDILVNVIGGIRPGAIGWQMSEEDWDFEIDLNLKTQFLFARAVVPHMKERRYGKIVNIISEAGRHRATVTGLGYVAGKAGALGLTRRLAFELGPFGITVNAVSPGNVLTELGRQQYNDMSPEVRANEDRETPLGRWAEPQEIANAILFMCSDLSRYVTGVTLSVSGGRYMV